MPTVYVRRVNLKDSLSDAGVAAFWKWTLEEVVAALLKVPGIRSVKLYSGAGGLRADIRYVFEMDDAGAYERALADPPHGARWARGRPLVPRRQVAHHARWPFLQRMVGRQP